MKKLQLGKDTLILAILTLITSLTWISLEVYWALTKTEIPRVLKEQISPLDPKIDWETVEELKTRNIISKEELETIVTLEVTPSPEVTPSSEATPSSYD